ncbi:MAG: FABP family protein [Micrococcaceae bacterium]
MTHHKDNATEALASKSTESEENDTVSQKTKSETTDESTEDSHTDLGFEEEEFIQEISFSHRDLPYLEYKSETWLVDENGEKGRPLSYECGVWQLDRNASPLDAGPGMFPGSEEPAFKDAEAVEHLRNPQEGFDIMANIVHPGGISELYVGDVQKGRINLHTDMVMRTKGAKEYTAATRMYGWVNGDLLWAWDIAAHGKPLNTHASAQLKKVYRGDDE